MNHKQVTPCIRTEGSLAWYGTKLETEEGCTATQKQGDFPGGETGVDTVPSASLT